MGDSILRKTFLTFLKSPPERFCVQFYNMIDGFVKTRSQKDLKLMKKGVNWIENQGENWYKMLKIC